MSKINIQDQSGDKKYFTIIPNYILNHSTIYDREVYVQMKRIAGEHGTCWKSQASLAKQCGISINRLKKSITYLVEHGWIKKIGTKEVKTRGGGQAVNEYIIADLWKMNSDFYDGGGVSPYDIPNKGVSPKTQRGITKTPKGVSPEGYKEEPIKEEPIKEEHTFSIFWKEYPNKTNKKKSIELWKSKKLGTQLEVILDFIFRAKNTDRWQKGYIKAPDVFIRNESWEDDLSAYGESKKVTAYKNKSGSIANKIKTQ